MRDHEGEVIAKFHDKYITDLECHKVTRHKCRKLFPDEWCPCTVLYLHCRDTCHYEPLQRPVPGPLPAGTGPFLIVRIVTTTIAVVAIIVIVVFVVVIAATVVAEGGQGRRTSRTRTRSRPFPLWVS